MQSALLSEVPHQNTMHNNYLHPRLQHPLQAMECGDWCSAGQNDSHIEEAI